MSDILVIGGTGKIGSSLVSELKEKGADFSLLVRDPAKMAKLDNEGVNCIGGDYSDNLSLDQAMKGVNKLFLLVAPHINMGEHEESIINSAVKNGVHHILKISAIASDSDSSTNLGQSHHKSEEMIKSSGVNYTILRPHSFMQNMLMNIGTIKEQGMIYSTLGQSAIPMIDVRDIATASANILLNPEPYNQRTITITGPESLSQDQAAVIIGETIGKDVNHMHVPDEAAKGAMMGIGLPEWLCDDLLTLNETWRNGKDNTPNEEINGLIDRDPITFATFIRDHQFLFV